jgi:hypothetical protein
MAPQCVGHVLRHGLSVNHHHRHHHHPPPNLSPPRWTLLPPPQQPIASSTAFHAPRACGLWQRCPEVTFVCDPILLQLGPDFAAKSSGPGVGIQHTHHTKLPLFEYRTVRHMAEIKGGYEIAKKKCLTKSMVLWSGRIGGWMSSLHP